MHNLLQPMFQKISSMFLKAIINSTFAKIFTPYMKEKDILAAVAKHYQIDELNEIQKATLSKSADARDIILLSPTGSGKTIAFLIPLIKALKDKPGILQAVIIAPSRELVLQIAGITANLATGFKVTCCYGGHNVLDEKKSLSVVPSIIVSTPGRLLDHINRGNIDVHSATQIVLDEFDKSLELGFQDEMKRIIRKMPNISRHYLTSATSLSEIPDFINIDAPVTLNFLHQNAELNQRIDILKVQSPQKDKLSCLLDLLRSIPNGRTIVFANHREAVERIYNYLIDNQVSAGIYHGGLDQIQREKAITLFNNGSFITLVTTDLGARGLDIAEVMNIIHYHIPTSAESYTHRNGRTARVAASGNVYVILGPQEKAPAFIKFDEVYTSAPSV